MSSSSFLKWAKLANIVPLMDINISNLPVCYFQGFFFVFLFEKHLSTWPPPPLLPSIHPSIHPSIQGTIQHSHANRSNIQTKTLFWTKKQKLLGGGKHDMILWATRNCPTCRAPGYIQTLKLGWEAIWEHALPPIHMIPIYNSFIDGPFAAPSGTHGLGGNGECNVLCSKQPCKMKAHNVLCSKQPCT
jgi:hypothetical protein